MEKLGLETKILDFQEINDALYNITKVQTFKGHPLNQKTHAIRNEIDIAVSDWEKLNPAEFHTAAGLDALKKKVYDIRDSTQYGTPERLVADQAARAIKRTIVSEFPQYARIMRGYEEASTLVKEIEGALVGRPGSRIDTSLRKLQSVLRNNVNTNY